jgi:RHS repeat-associated protein
VRDDKYRLNVSVVDESGEVEGATTAGVRRIRVLAKRPAEADSAYRQLASTGDRSCPNGSCPLELAYEHDHQAFETQYGATDAAVFRVEVLDHAGHRITDDFTVQFAAPAADAATAAGTEPWFEHATPIETGAGSAARVNVATGNVVWRKELLENRGRGLDTVAALTYSSKAGRRARVEPVGQRFVLELSTLAAVNEPLDLATATTQIKLRDADGTLHTFTTLDGLRFKAPPGLHVNLRRFSDSDATRRWAITRPNGVTHFFDDLGYERWVQDRNGNTLRLDYEPAGTARRLVAVTDAAGLAEAAPNRAVRLAYHGSDAEEGAAGKVRSITDHAGIRTELEYDSRGRLEVIREATTTSEERATELTYSSALLDTVIDPLGEVTDFGYVRQTGDRLSGTRVTSIVDRRGSTTGYAYAFAAGASGASTTTRVTDPRGKTTSYVSDDRSRVTQITDPLERVTTLGWDAQNHLERRVEAVGTQRQVATETTWNANGLALTVREPGGRTTTYSYRDAAGTVVGPHDAGGTFVSDLVATTDPRGNATPEPGDFTTTYEPDAAGNVLREWLPGRANPIVRQYDARGQLLQETTETGATTRYEAYDANGMPRTEVDPRGTSTTDANDGRWLYRYDARGSLTAAADPRGAGSLGPTDPLTTYTTSFTYDALGRETEERTPKDSASGQYVSRTTEYDENDATTAEVDATGARTEYDPDEMGNVLEERAPATEHAGEAGAEPEVTRYEYDDAGNLVAEVAPEGTETAAGGDHVTEYVLDAAGQVVAEIKQSAEGGEVEEHVTSYAYDERGNVVGVVDPETNAELGGDPIANAAGEENLRLKYEYDAADREVAQIEDPGEGGEALRTERRYDANDNVVAQVDPGGFEPGANPDEFTTRWTYDQRDLNTVVTDPEGGVTRLDVADDGKLLAETLPNGSETAVDGDFQVRYEYYPTGELRSESLPRAAGQYGPADAKFTYERDPVGNPHKITDARGNLIANEFYDSGELKSTNRPSLYELDPANGETEPLELEPADLEAAAEAQLDELGGLPEQQAAAEASGDFGNVEAADAPELLPKAGQTQFRYDAEMRVTTVIDQAGDESSVTRDRTGRVTQLRQPLDATGASGQFVTTSFRYDRNGNLAETTDPAGNTTRVEYDQFDRPVREVAPGSSGPEVTEISYDRNGNTEAVQTPRGPDATYRYGHDKLDRLRSEKDPLGNETTYEYDAAGNVDLERTPRGHATRYEYDGLGQIRSIVDPLGQTTTIDYDANGNAIEIVAPGAASGPGAAVEPRVVRRRYDGRDLPWVETVGTGDDARTTVTEFDPNGNLRRVVQPEGISDATGLPATTDPGGAIDDRTSDNQRLATRNATVREYSAEGLLTSIHLPWGEDDDEDRRRYREDIVRDGLGRIVAIDAPYAWADGQRASVRTAYDHYDTGWIKTARDMRRTGPGESDFATDHVSTYAYDGRGLQTRWRQDGRREARRSYYPNGLLERRTAVALNPATGAETSSRAYVRRYDANGMVTEIHDETRDRRTRSEYDLAGRQTLVDETWTDGSDTRLVYDADGNVTRRLTDGQARTPTSGDPRDFVGGKTAAFTYDALGRETRSVVSQAGLPDRETTTSYHPSGEPRMQTRPGGVTEETYFDAVGDLARLVRKCRGGTVTLRDQVYEYNANGNRTRDERGTYRFNARQQLERWTRANGPQAGTIVDYELDGTGAVTRQVDDGAETTFAFQGRRLVSETTQTSSGPVATTYSYDALGSLSEARTGSHVARYTHDEFGRLLKVDAPDGAVSYTYDALDRRETRTEGGVVSRMAYIGLSEEVAHTGADGGAVRFFDYNADLSRTTAQAVVDPDRPDGFRPFAEDASSSVESLVAADGSSVATADSYAYDPYGALESQGVPPSSAEPNPTPEGELSAEAQENPVRFQGFHADPDAGVYDMEARAYVPQVGRFTTQDRFEQASEDRALQLDPATNNRYAFAGGNPVDKVEMDGHRARRGRTPRAAPARSRRAQTRARAAQRIPSRVDRWCRRLRDGNPAPASSSLTTLLRRNG